MAVYRLTDPNPAYVNLLGTSAAPGGSLTFCDLGTTDEKDTYADFDKETPNANPVELDSSGRADTEIWLDGEYTVTLKDANGTTIWTRDVRPEVAPGLALPDPVGNDGKVVVASGSGYVLEERLQLPDPTGSGGYMLVVNSDGTSYSLQPQPEIVIPDPPEPEYTIGTTSIQIGTFLIQTGTGTAPASGTKNTSTAITFPTAYASLLHVNVIPTGTTVTAGGASPTATVTGATVGSGASGFTANFNASDEHGGSNDWTITSPVNFMWVAFGLVADE